MINGISLSVCRVGRASVGGGRVGGGRLGGGRAAGVLSRAMEYSHS